jgi:hypothetical protein
MDGPFCVKVIIIVTVKDDVLLKRPLNRDTSQVTQFRRLEIRFVPE